MKMEKKWILWSIAALCIALAAVPSVVLYNAAGKYFGFIGSWKTGVIRPAKTNIIPAQRFPVYMASKEPLPEVKFVKFSLWAPDAKSVMIAADFNRWNAELLPLSRLQNGTWEVLIPLPPGKYNYLYKVDGALMADPGNPETGYHDRRQTSVMVVK